MADYNLLSDVSNRAKEYIYKDKFIEYILFDDKQSKLFNQMRLDDARSPKIAVRGYDDKYILPYRYQIPMGAGWSGENKPLHPSGKEASGRMTTSLRTLKGRYQQSWEKSQSVADEQGFIAQKSMEIVQDCATATKMILTISMYGYEYGGATPANAYHIAGGLGTVDSWTDGTATVNMRMHSTFKGEPGAMWIYPGMRVLFATIAELTGGTVAYGTEALVYSVDYDAGSFVIKDTDGTTWSGTDPAAGDIVVLGYCSSVVAANTAYISYDYAPISLREHISTSTRRNYQGAARGVYQCGNIAHNSGTSRALSETIIRNALALSYVKTKSEPNPNPLMVMSISTELQYRALFDTYFRYAPNQAPQGAKVFSNQMNIDGVEFFKDPWCPDGEILVVDPSDFLQICPMGGNFTQLETQGGEIFLLLGDNAELDIKECRWRTQYQLAGLNNNKQLRIKDLN